MIDDRGRALLDRLRGYLIPITTPFTKDLEVDTAGIETNVGKALALPASAGIYVGSVYTEFWTLSMSERMLLAESTVRIVDGRAPVVIGVSSTGLSYTLELAEHAESIGADMLMVWPPIFGDRDDEGVFTFYKTVAAAVSTPICVYSSTLEELGFYIRPELLTRLATLPSVSAVKEASFSITTYLSLLKAIGDQVAISTPFEEYWLTGLALVPDRVPRFLMGSSRAMYMQTPARPTVAECFELGMRQRLVEAYDKLNELKPLITAMQMRHFASGRHPIGVVKYATELLGWAGGPVRPPTPTATTAEREFTRESLRAAGLV